MTTSHFTRAYAHREDCFIDRKHSLFPNSAVLFDADGGMLWRFDADWTDDQIWTALEFANKCYLHGTITGERAKAHEIRTALEL